MPSGSMVFLVFTGVVTFAVLLQTIILVVVVAGAKQAQQKMAERMERLHEELRPILTAGTHVLELVEDVAPRIRTIAENVEVASQRLRGQVDHIDSVVKEAAGKTRHQVNRVDRMVTDTLDSIARGTRTVQENVMAPLRQIGGWMATVRTAMDLIRRGGDRRSRPRDNDFI
ncbi:MAG: hypothetical protein ACYDC6_11650 [Acidobacteriaceae bacterium]